MYPYKSQVKGHLYIDNRGEVIVTTEAETRVMQSQDEE